MESNHQPLDPNSNVLPIELPSNNLAPKAGFEPTTSPLTGVCSAFELLRNNLERESRVELEHPGWKPGTLPIELLPHNLATTGESRPHIPQARLALYN